MTKKVSVHLELPDGTIVVVSNDVKAANSANYIADWLNSSCDCGIYHDINKQFPDAPLEVVCGKLIQVLAILVDDEVVFPEVPAIDKEVPSAVEQ